MTDNEIIKGWEFCTKRTTIADCIGCPYRDIENCLDTMLKDSFGLYNRQKAEIEKLQKMLDLAENCIDEVEDALYRGEKNYYAEQAIERYKEMTEG